MHSETRATRVQRYHARGRTPATRPDPGLLLRAFLWREQRRVTSTATVSLHGNRYELDAALVPYVRKDALRRAVLPECVAVGSVHTIA